MAGVMKPITSIPYNGGSVLAAGLFAVPLIVAEAMTMRKGRKGCPSGITCAEVSKNGNSPCRLAAGAGTRLTVVSVIVGLAALAALCRSPNAAKQLAGLSVVVTAAFGINSLFTAAEMDCAGMAANPAAKVPSVAKMSSVGKARFSAGIITCILIAAGVASMIKKNL